MFRISLVLFFGKWGLPIPFRNRLMYVMGRPILPSWLVDNNNKTLRNRTSTMDAAVEDMYQQYCQELVRVFDRHKESYASGWENKSLTILPPS
jgi:hypothetical protein